MCAASPMFNDFSSSECGPLVGLGQSGFEHLKFALFASSSFVFCENSFGSLDVHLLEGTLISINSLRKKIIETSHQCHINIIYDSKDTFELIAPYIYYPGDITVKYYDFPTNWLDNDGKLPVNIADYLKISEIKDGVENPAEGIQVSTLTGYELVLENISVDTRYLVRYKIE